MPDIYGMSNVIEYSFDDCQQITEIVLPSFDGLVNLYYINFQPINIFKYISAGVPVIASIFLLWGEIIEENQCRFCVNPISLEEVLR